MVCSCCAYNCTQRHKHGSNISFHSFPRDSDLQKRWLIALKRENFTPSAGTKICSRHFKETDFVYSFGKKTLAKDCVPSIFDFPSPSQEKKVKSRARLKVLKKDTATLPSSLDENINYEQEEVCDEVPLLSKEDGKEQNNTLHSLSKKIRPQMIFIVPTPTGDRKGQNHTNLSNNIAAVLSAIHSNNRNQVILSNGSLQNRNRQLYFGDFTSEDLKSPESVHRMWLAAKKTIEKQKHTIKYLQNRTSRLTRKVNSLQGVILQLKSNKKN